MKEDTHIKSQGRPRGVLQKGATNTEPQKGAVGGGEEIKSRVKVMK